MILYVTIDMGSFKRESGFMDIKIGFTKYGKKEFKESGMTMEELKDSISKTMQKNNKTGYVICEPVDRGDLRFSPDGTIKSENTFLLQGVRTLLPQKRKNPDGSIEIVWLPMI